MKELKIEATKYILLLVIDVCTQICDKRFLINFFLGKTKKNYFQEILCYMFNMFSWSTNAGATYTVIAMALNRVVAIKAPFWYNNNVSSTTAHKISLAVLIFAGAMGSQALAFYRLDKTRGCTWFSSLNAAFVMAFVNTAVFFFIPIVVLVVSDLIFVRGLAERTSKSLSSGARGAPTKDAATLERERQKESRAREYTIFLICLTISYLVCYLGVGIFSSMAGWGAAYGDLLRVISKLFVIVNNSKNFIFYYMSGDAFRSAFKQVLRSSK